MAETYVLEDENGCEYFCKVVDKHLFIPEIIKSLPVVEEMHANGVERICYPIRGGKGLYITVNGILIVLFNYIPFPQNYEYRAYSLGQLIAQIHLATPRMTVDISKESFEFTYRLKFEQQLENALQPKSAERALIALQKVLSTHEKSIRSYYAEFLRLTELCKKEACKLVITHGDAPGNVLVKAVDDLYIIDWDEVMLTAAERDFWMMDHVPEFMLVIEIYLTIMK